MAVKTAERNSFATSALGRSKEVTSKMLQEEGEKLYEAKECIPGREWAEWFRARRFSGLQHKT